MNSGVALSARRPMLEVLPLHKGDRAKRSFGILIVIVGLMLARPSLASDLIISRAALEDATGALTIADVAGRITLPAGPVLAINSTKSAHWLCVHVRVPANGSKVVLFIRPTYINEVRLYEAGSGNPSRWKTRVTGNDYPYGDRDRANISLGFVVDVAAPESTFYLRFKSRSAAKFTVEALEPNEADQKDHQRDLVEVFFVTAMLGLLCWALLSYLLDRLPVVGLFAVHQATYTLFGVVVTGYLAPLAPAMFPKLVDWVNAILYLAINFTTLLFCRELFKPYKPPPALIRGINLLLCTFPVLLVALALGYYPFAINTNAALIKITWLYFVVIAFALRAESTPSRRLMRAFFVLVFASNAVFWIAGRNSQVASRISLSAIQQLIIDGLLMGTLFALMLHARARLARQVAQESALNLLLVQEKFEIEQELKNQAELKARTDYLTGQPNRRRFVELAERELARSIRFQRPFTFLMIDVDHFKAINDSWGHSVGDAVLQRVAYLIRDALRDEDVFGRIGGEEFAAVIVEADSKNAMEVAQRLCSTVAEEVINPPGAGHIQVTLSIGLSQLKGRNIPLASLLNEADRAMYDAKQAGRNGLAVCE